MRTAFGFFLLVGILTATCRCSSSCPATFPETSSAPSLTYYFGSATATTGTTLTSTGQFSGYINASGCGPFGIWENSNGGEVATEIEMRLNTRLGVFAMADGIVTEIQQTSSPYESGEVEGVWIRYGSNYIIKYVHVKDPTVAVGATVSAGQRIGEAVNISSGIYFIEAELRQKDGNTIYAKPFNSLLTNASTFNALYGTGNCVPGGTILGTNGSTVTTASNWVNNQLSPAQWDVTSLDEPCSFP
jgi:murein DD-endopeptidase MepM/ murein hydrolase activator NlpD